MDKEQEISIVNSAFKALKEITEPWRQAGMETPGISLSQLSRTVGTNPVTLKRLINENPGSCLHW